MELDKLVSNIRKCNICSDLPLGPNPVLQISSTAKILIAGQAPGTKVHKTGIPFDDPSGERLRKWMGVDSATFYDESLVAILPMAFCYPGKGKSGDLPPRKECHLKWRDDLMKELKSLELIICIGQYAIDWHLKNVKKKNLTETVKAWRQYLPIFPIPHPSPRNNIWLKKNEWFEEEMVPFLQEKISAVLS
jgi:uracil-DNA glycosylase